MSRTRQVAVGLAVIWAAIVAYLGLTAKRGILGLPDSLAEPAQHFVSLAVLSALLAIAFPRRMWRIGIALAIVGTAGEVLQLATDDRQFDLVDIGMNLFGIAVGLGSVAFAGSIRFVHAARATIGVTIALLLAGPFVLPVAVPTRTSFPSECTTARPPVGGEPMVLFDGLSDSDDSAIDDISVAQIKDAVTRTTEFSVEAWFSTPNLQQAGPARVFTISDGIGLDEMNVHVGVEGSSLSVRLRTSCELSNRLLIEDVIKVDQLQHIVVTWSGGMVESWVDGEMADRTQLPWGDFAAWDSDFSIVVGNEVGGRREFEGHVASVTMWDRALDAQMIADRVAPTP